MKTKYTIKEVIAARKYWGCFTYLELHEWWKHYTIGKGKGMYSVSENASLADYLVESAYESEYARVHDI